MISTKNCMSYLEATSVAMRILLSDPVALNWFRAKSLWVWDLSPWIARQLTFFLCRSRSKMSTVTFVWQNTRTFSLWKFLSSSIIASLLKCLKKTTFLLHLKIYSPRLFKIKWLELHLRITENFKFLRNIFVSLQFGRSNV